jgi:hypothetical protein
MIAKGSAIGTEILFFLHLPLSINANTIRYIIESDVELLRQTRSFNIAVGRNLQRHFGMRPQFGLLIPILIWNDGSPKNVRNRWEYVRAGVNSDNGISKLEKNT